MIEGHYPPVYQVDYSPLISANIKKEGNYTSVPPVYLHGTEKDNFTFTTLFDLLLYQITYIGAYYNTCKFLLVMYLWIHLSAFVKSVSF